MRNKRFLLSVLFIFSFVGLIIYISNTNSLKISVENEYTRINENRKSSNCFLIVCSKGNLGNQIWEYMSLYVVWQKFRKFGHIPHIEERMMTNLNDVFANLTITSSNDIDAEEVCTVKENTWTISKQIDLEFYASWFEESATCRNIFLDVYSTRYKDILAFSVEKIKEEMRFKEDLIKETESALWEVSRSFGLHYENVTFVGMHYRGGDYVDHLKNYYNKEELADHYYYKRAMRYFNRKYKDVIFILITIDTDWLVVNRDQIESEGNVIVNPYENDRIRDLVLLCHCHHSIISYGTFGATAAFFAGGTTFVYDLKLPVDHRGATIALGMTKLLQNWHAIT